MAFGSSRETGDAMLHGAPRGDGDRGWHRGTGSQGIPLGGGGGWAPKPTAFVPIGSWAGNSKRFVMN